MRCDKCRKELKEGETVYLQYLEAEVPDEFKSLKILCSQCHESLPNDIQSEWEAGFVADGGFYPYSWD